MCLESLSIIHTLTPGLAKNKQKYLDILRTTFEEIASPFTNRILNHYRTLTPTEIDICNMIRNGLRTKEIAELRGVSAATISRHREHIRRKLNIANENVNLTAYLQSLPAPDMPDRPRRDSARKENLIEPLSIL